MKYITVIFFIMFTDVRRGASGMSRDVPIFVKFHKKNQDLYTLIDHYIFMKYVIKTVRVQNSLGYWLKTKSRKTSKKPKFVHFGGKKPKIRTL